MGVARGRGKDVLIVENEYKISICGNECTIVSSESAEFVEALTAEVEDRINEVYSSSDKVTFGIASMISAMSLCEELQQMRLSCENMRTQIKTYLDEVARANGEKDEALFEVERLRREIDRLRQGR